MSGYVDDFRQAIEHTDSIFGGMSNYPLKIDQSYAIDLDATVEAIAKDFSEFIPHTDAMPGMCFTIARELSYVLFDLGIRHTVTIGDIELVDGLYVGISSARMQGDIVAGYQIDVVDGIPTGRPADAHAWITLENGSVIDATILASQHRKNAGAKKPLSFRDAIYHSGKLDTCVVRHIPMFTGLVYHQKVLTAPNDGYSPFYIEWYQDYAASMGRLDAFRLMPWMLP